MSSDWQEGQQIVVRISLKCSVCFATSKGFRPRWGMLLS
jgi:hypothetical protein